MIPKPLNEIQWADLEALRDSGREESDTIEYKSSFSGGSDFLAISGGEHERAVKAIAREAIAFLNGRGGDIIIGAEEASHADPRINAFKPLQNVSESADRLAQILGSLIEPYQSVLGVRAIKSEGDNMGVIVVRAPASLRAPHRFMRDKQCYIRRGRESVPMHMDEIQDLTLNRMYRRSERTELLSKQFQDFHEKRSGFHKFDKPCFHICSVYVPFISEFVELDNNILNIIGCNDPKCLYGENSININSPFQSILYNWKPMMHGKRIEAYYESNGLFRFCMKSIKRNLILRTEFVDSGDSFEGSPISVQWNLIRGYLANTFYSYRLLLNEFPQFVGGFLSTYIRIGNDMHLNFGDSYQYYGYPLQEGIFEVGTVDLTEIRDMNNFFMQFQTDVMAIAGHEETPISLPAML